MYYSLFSQPSTPSSWPWSRLSAFFQALGDLFFGFVPYSSAHLFQGHQKNGVHGWDAETRKRNPFRRALFFCGASRIQKALFLLMHWGAPKLSQQSIDVTFLTEHDQTWDYSHQSYPSPDLKQLDGRGLLGYVWPLSRHQIVDYILSSDWWYQTQALFQPLRQVPQTLLNLLQAESPYTWRYSEATYGHADAWPFFSLWLYECSQYIFDHLASQYSRPYISQIPPEDAKVYTNILGIETQKDYTWF